MPVNIGFGSPWCVLKTRAGGASGVLALDGFSSDDFRGIPPATLALSLPLSPTLSWVVAVQKKAFALQNVLDFSSSAGKIRCDR